MRLTTRQLRRIIKEETRRLLSEADGEFDLIDAMNEEDLFYTSLEKSKIGKVLEIKGMLSPEGYGPGEFLKYYDQLKNEKLKEKFEPIASALKTAAKALEGIGKDEVKELVSLYDQVLKKRKEKMGNVRRDW